MAQAVPAFTPVVRESVEMRIDFLANVYRHLGLAIAAFIAFEVVLFQIGAAEAIWRFVSRGGATWLVLLGGFIVVNWFATMAAYDMADRGRQYLGLFGVAAAEAVIFAPFLFYVFEVRGSEPVMNAAVITVIGFGVLSLVAYTTRRDLGFLRPLVMWGFGLALLLIVGAVLFGLNLGTWFSVAMIGLAGAAILYQTQRIYREYPAEAYVGAAATLFASLMTMFWYVLRIFARD